MKYFLNCQLFLAESVSDSLVYTEERETFGNRGSCQALCIAAYLLQKVFKPGLDLLHFLLLFTYFWLLELIKGATTQSEDA